MKTLKTGFFFKPRTACLALSSFTRVPGHERFKMLGPFGSWCGDELRVFDVVEAESARSPSRFIVVVHALARVLVRERLPVLLEAAVELFSDA
ncbi:hypothetical protein [Bradyrhizobium sp.]|uniref:hypothetical protein n=1 Tax=Bradyrhizobium sp. TaxID=376 RepID=UPI003C60B138